MNQREKCKRIQEKQSCNISVVWCDAGEQWGPLLGGAQEGAGALGFPNSVRSSTTLLWEEPRRDLSWPILSAPLLMEISTDAGTSALPPVVNNTFPPFNFYFTKMNIMDFLIVIGA